MIKIFNHIKQFFRIYKVLTFKEFSKIVTMEKLIYSL